MLPEVYVISSFVATFLMLKDVSSCPVSGVSSKVTSSSISADIMALPVASYSPMFPFPVLFVAI